MRAPRNLIFWKSPLGAAEAAPPPRDSVSLQSSVFLLRPDLPVITTCRASDLVDGAAAIADYKHKVYDGATRAPQIQIDHPGARAVCPNLIGTRLTHSKVGQGGSHQKPVSRVINLREVALAVELRDADDKILGGQVCESESVIALERRVRAPVLVSDLRPGYTAQRRQSDRSRQHSIPKPAFHLRPPFLRIGRYIIACGAPRFANHQIRPIPLSCDDVALFRTR
jgi:hypothetical protein